MEAFQSSVRASKEPATVPRALRDEGRRAGLKAAGGRRPGVHPPAWLVDVSPRRRLARSGSASRRREHEEGDGVS
eukprot:1779808-Heterocapsa_arctica.AAC.1